MPIGMCATTPEIAEAFADSGLHFNTFGGNAVASAAGLATLKVNNMIATATTDELYR